jgi:hypothetical protein
MIPTLLIGFYQFGLICARHSPDRPVFRGGADFTFSTFFHLSMTMLGCRLLVKAAPANTLGGFEYTILPS